jgi:hypothetical protein
MAQPRTFYVLGAGASYGLIPVTKSLRQIIKAEYHSVGVYPVTRASSSPLFERVIGEIAPYEDDLQEILLTHMPEEALDFLAQRALWRPSSDVNPPQYAVFEFVPASATFFNFNLDGLASLHCSHRHIVLEPHGRIDVPWLEHEGYQDLLEGTVVYEVRVPHLAPKLLPGPEPEDITRGPSYTEAQKLFRHAQAMIILGYSFGQRSTIFDDKQSFEFLAALLKSHPRPVLVISTTPAELTERLRDRLSTYNVHSISLRWELFSGLLLASIDPAEGISPHWCAKRLRSLAYAYERGLDAM